MTTTNRYASPTDYWLCGCENSVKKGLLMLFRIDWFNGSPVDGMVVCWWGCTAMRPDEYFIADGKRFSRKEVYTADELRSLWTILISSGLWEPCAAPVPDPSVQLTGT